MKKFWSFSYYFWQFAGVGFMAAFVVLFYQKLHFSGFQIGLLTGLSPLVTLFFAPLLTGIADATRRHRLVFSLTLLGGSLAIFATPLASTFLPVLGLVLLTSICLAPVGALADAATLSMLGAEKSLYGRLRLGGTIGYAIAAPIAGWLVLGYGIQWAFWGCAVMYVLGLLVGQKFEHPAVMVRSGASLAEARRVLMKNPRWLLFLFAALGGGMALSFSVLYFFPYMKELGANEAIMGIAITIGTVCEVPVMFFANLLIKRFRAYPLFIMALVISGLRLLLLFIASTPNQALLIQLLNGFTFPAMWLAGVAYTDEHAPVGMSATAQGIFGAVVFGIGMAIGGFMGGTLLGSVGARGLCLVFGVLTLVIVGMTLGIGRLLPAEKLQTNA